MSKPKTITSTEEAAAAPIGTVVVSSERNYRSKSFIVEQKHGDNEWYPATGWEGSTPDKNIRGRVLQWGTRS